jgi:hypothetical protein
MFPAILFLRTKEAEAAREKFMHDLAVAATFVAMVLSPIVPTLFYREVEEVG